MIPLISIYAGGILSLIMAGIHTRFYTLFNWKSEFNRISTANARIFYTVHLALLFMFFLIGVISILYAGELSRSIGLANGVNLILALFWLWRLIWQFLYFRARKGRKYPPLVILLSILFFLLMAAYMTPVVFRFIL